MCFEKRLILDTVYIIDRVWATDADCETFLLYLIK